VLAVRNPQPTANKRPDRSVTVEDPRRFMQVAKELRDQIGDGRLKPGCRLPSIGTLTQETDSSRQTIGRALRLLEREGLLTRIPGLGYFVEE
jgi:DNA-binding GntR family transcriptional regulator